MWRDPFEELRRLERRLNRILSELWEKPAISPRSLPYSEIREPFIDIQETDKEIIVTAEIPGVEKENIKVNVYDNTLEISASISKEEEEKREGFIRKERRLGKFYRAITLPCEVLAEKAKATYKNGVLEIRLPKAKVEEGTLIKVE